MKINDVASDVQVSDQGNAFTIAATGKAFKILSDGLYSDKITAIIRELSCNAYDSHVAIGKPNMPFDVHLPSHEEKWFSVTDFGTGISDEDIHKIYTRYFASTKTSSNDFVGQLGLGSKSPFSYTREFKVRSRFNGLERTYRMYFDDTDTPRVEFLYEKDCAAAGLPPTGLDVSFDVSEHDMSRFRSRAADVLSWFKVTPNITGYVTNLRIDPIVKDMTPGGWMIRQKNGYNSIPPIALMGNVAYPIDPDNIEDITTRDRSLLSMPVVIQFNIGDLEVSASRESLGYDKKTQANIIARCQVVAGEIHNHYDNLVKACATKWEARRFHDQVFGFGGGSNRYQMRDLFDGFTLTWKDGTVIDSSYARVDLTTVYALDGRGYRVHTGSAGKMVLSRIHNDLLKSFEQPCADKNIVVFNDCDRGGLNRIKNWAKTERDTRFTVYDKPDLVTWDQLRDMLGNPPVLMSSSMPAPVTAKIAKATMMVYEGSNYNKHLWSDVTIDMNLGGYWISSFNKEPIGSKGNRVDVKRIMECAKRLGFVSNDARVYAPKGAMRKKIEKTKGWVNIVDFLTERVNAGWKQDVVDSMATVIAWKDLMRKSGCAEMQHGIWDLRDKNGLMQRIVDIDMEMSMVSNSVEYQRMSTIRNLADMLGINLPIGKPDDAKLHVAADVGKRYPMLKILDYRQWRDNFNMIVQYVNMVDASYVFYALTEPELEPEYD